MKSLRWGLLGGVGCALVLALGSVSAQIVTTVAGSGTAGFNSDGIAATGAQLNTPYEVFLDAQGNLFIADYNNTRIRRVGTNGLISTVAGTGVNGFGGDGAAATSARLTKPTGVFVDAAGNILIPDTGNNRVRRVDTATGDITTIAGTGTGAFGGDGAAATAAQISAPYSVLVDTAGNIFISDSANDRIRRIDAATGDISTFAGTGTGGFSGDGGPATAAAISAPAGMAFDAQGNLYFSDLSNNRVRKIDLNGDITTVAGNGLATYNGDGIQATNASLAGPRGLAVDSLGRIFIADATHHRVRMVDTNGVISTIAGTGTAGFAGDGGLATAAQFSFPSGVQVAGNGDVYVTDQNNHRVRRITAPVLTTLAGTVRNAATGAGLPGVSISVGTNTVVSDATGAYALPGLLVGPVQLIATNAGFIGLTNSLTLTNAPTNQFSFAMSPVILGANTFRIVLTWGAQPADLDSYTMTPVIGGSQHEVNFFNRGSLTAAPFVFLDVDDVNGFGPETTTITNLFPGTYEFYVENFSGTPAIAGSGAQVSVYSAAGLLQTITVPATGSGFYWRVLQIDGASGQLTVLNVVTNVQPTFPASTAPTIVNQPISQTGFRSNSVTFSVSASGANPLAYQWFFNSNVLAGATNTTLPLTNLQTNQAGSYFVVVTNGFGGVTSSIATLTVLTNAQPPPFQWVVSGGTDPNTDNAGGVAADAAGNSYFAGSFQGTVSFGGAAIATLGSFDALFAKLDSLGRTVWLRQDGSGSGVRSDRGLGITVDAAGNVYGCGRFEGAYQLGASQIFGQGGDEGFVVKFDSNGNRQWIRAQGGGGDDKANAVAADTSGNLFVAGDLMGGPTFNSAVFDTITVTNRSVVNSAFNGYVAKYGPTGTILWAISYGGTTNSTTATGIGTDAAGNAYVVGRFTGTIEFGTNTVIASAGTAFNDGYVAKLSPAGVVQWIRTFPRSPFAAVRVQPGGTLYLAGTFGGTQTYGPNTLIAAPNGDAFVLKLDAAGNPVWAKQSVSSGNSVTATGITTDAQENVFVTGSFNTGIAFGGFPLISAGLRDGYVAKYDLNGSALWAKRSGGGADDFPRGVAADGAGNALVAGEFTATSAFDALLVPGGSVQDFYLTRIAASAGPLPVPPGLSAWWAGDGNNFDYASTNHALTTNVVFGVGQVQQAFDHNGASSRFRVPAAPALNVGAGAGFTVEFWLRPRNVQTAQPVVEWHDLTGFVPPGFAPAQAGIRSHLWINITSGNPNYGGALYANLISTNGVNHFFNTAPGLLFSNLWQHVALTYSQASGTVNVLLNGNVVATTNLPGNPFISTSDDLLVGYRPTGVTGGTFLDGLLDELSLYSRALSLTEIQAIFTAGMAGKARPAAPTLLAPPAPLTVDQGAPALFGVAAAGHAPLAYQWRLNGTNLPGQTNFTLALPAAWSVHEGNYDVQVTQLGGAFLTSPPAALNVLGQGEVKTLFGVSNDVVNFTRLGGGAVPWTLTPSNTLIVIPGTGSIQSTQNFGDFLLHAEFRCPSPTDVANGNSGIYLQNRYEIQIFNSFGVAVPGLNDAGAIWGQTPPSTNAALPAGQWQTYDIHFRQPQWNGNTKVADARVTVVLNGVVVQDNVAITNRTGSGAAEGPTLGPVVLQDNGSSVQFRNVRITPLDLPPEIVRAQSFGGTLDDSLNYQTLDAAGNTFLAGSFQGTTMVGTNVLVSAGLYDAYLAKLNAAGNVLWVRQVGSTGDESGFGVAPAPNGDVFFCGRFHNTASFGTTNLTASGQDLFLARYDGNGNLLWARKAGGTGTDAAYAVAADAAGNGYIAGNFDGTADFGGTQLTSGSGQNSFVAKYGPSGALVWAVRLGGTGTVDTRRIRLDGATNVYVGGAFAGAAQFVTTPLTSAGQNDGFALKLDANGIVQWLTQFGGSNDDEVRAVVPAPDGTVGVAGSFRNTISIGTNTMSTAGGIDGFVAKLDAAGTPIWSRKLGGGGTDIVHALALDPFGGYVAVGSFNASATFNATTLNPSGSTDFFLVKYDASGAQRWVRANGNGQAIGGLEVQVDLAGSPVISGAFSGTLALDSLTVTSAGQADYFLGRLTNSTPAITQQPVGGNVLAGQNATFSVTATGTGPVTYQWRFNGTNLPGATNASFTLANATTNSAGAYDVLVTHAFGTATSSPAVITVIPSANPLPFTFAERYGGTGAESVQGLARDAAGNSYVAGYFTGTLALGTTNLVSAGGDDIFVAKVSPAGTVLWAAHCGGPGEDRATGLALDSNGDVVAVGWFDNNAVFGTNGAVALSVNLAAFTLRLSADGVLAGFHKTDFSGAGAGILRVRNFAVAVDAAGAVYVAGKGDDTNNFGGFTFGRPEVWGYLVKYDRAGSVQWIQASDRAPGTTQNVVGMAVALDQTGGVYLGGYYGLPGGNSGTNAIIGGVTLPYGGGDADAFIAKFSAATGAPVWTRGLHGPGRERVARLATDPAGNVFAYGDFSGPVNFGPGLLTPSNGSAGTGLLLKLDAAGTVVWAREAGAVGGSVLDFGALAVDPAGNVHVAHHFTGTSLLGNPAAVSLGGRDGLVTKFAANGAFLWAQTFGSPGDDFVNGLVFDTNFNLHVAGTLGGAATFGSFPLTNAGASDLFLARLAAIPPVILAQPASQTVNVNQSATFAVAVTGTLPITYQWRFNGANLPGATNAAFTVPAVTPASAGTYSVLVSDALGLAVSSNAVLAVDTSNVPVIFTQPQSQSAQQGQAVLFTVGAAGAQPLSYQWRKNGTNLAGAVFSFLPLGGVTTNDMGNYTVVITNVFGAVTSAPAVLTVMPIFPPVITTPPQALTVVVGSNATFSVAVSGTAPFSYQWVRNGVALSGNDAPTLTVTNAGLADAGTYFVQVFNSAGLASSTPVTLTVLDPPQLLTSPFSLTILEGRTTNLSAFATGTPAPAYAWFKDGIRLVNSVGFSGVGTSNLFLHGASAGHAGAYVVVATNVAGSVTSAPVTLTVLLAPVFTAHPTNVLLTRTNYLVDLPVMFTVAATGAPPLLYQWRFNGADLPGETNTTLVLTNVTRLHNGLYQATVTNVVGAATSSNALVRVRVPQRVASPVFTPGQPFRLRFTDDNGEQPAAVDLARIEVQFTTNLLRTNTVWVTLTNGFSIVGGMVELDDPASTNAVRRYYRVIEK